jgi:hypothetical protein
LLKTAKSALVLNRVRPTLQQQVDFAQWPMREIAVTVL